jgi:hypothetical protein
MTDIMNLKTTTTTNDEETSNTSIRKNPNYFKEYYHTKTKTKDDFKVRNKISYCKRIYQISFNKEDIGMLGDDYKIAARFYRDCQTIKSKYPDYYEHAINH